MAKKTKKVQTEIKQKKKEQTNIRKQISEEKTLEQQGFQTDMDVQMMMPFGPSMLKAKLPDRIVDMMLEITDDITKDTEKVNWGHALAGQIRDEPLISNELLKEKGLHNWFSNLAQYYITEHNKIKGVTLKMVDPIIETDITSMWIVNQKEGEYNPVHHHTNATISCVFYLKIPKYTPRELPYKVSADGSIEFVSHAGGEEYNTFNKGCYLTNPEVGDLYMFPSYLLHTVYPFLGEGERRSVSFNVMHRYVDKDKLYKMQLQQAKNREDTLKSELDELKEQVAELAKVK